MPALLDLAHPLEALELEDHIPDGENLVDQQDVGLREDRDREAEPHEHARSNRT